MKKSKAFLLASAGMAISALAYKVVKSKHKGVSEHELCKYKVEPSTSESGNIDNNGDVSDIDIDREDETTGGEDVYFTSRVEGQSLRDANPELACAVDEAIKEVVGDELYAKILSARESSKTTPRTDELDTEVIAKSIIKSAGIKPSTEGSNLDSDNEDNSYISEERVPAYNDRTSRIKNKQKRIGR